MGDCLYYKQFKHITGCIVHMGDCLYYKQFKHITGCIVHVGDCLYYKQFKHITVLYIWVIVFIINSLNILLVVLYI